MADNTQNTSNTTTLANLVNPQVVADVVDQNLTDAIQFLPLCKVDRKLEGHSGSKVTMPKYAYIVDGVEVAECG